MAEGFRERDTQIIVRSEELALDSKEIVNLVNTAKSQEVKGDSSSGDYCMENVGTLNMSCSVNSSGVYSYIIKASYNESSKELKTVDQRVAKIVKNQKLTTGSDYDKIKKITRWIVQNVNYDYSRKNDSAFKALKTGKATCMGYSLLFQKLATEAGLNTQTVRGYTADGYHMCNAVKLQGKWYYIDICAIDTSRSDNYFLFGSNFCKNYMSISSGYKVSGLSKKDYSASTTWLTNLFK